MPRSPNAPEPPPEPDVNELIQTDVARIKRLLGLDVNRLALGSEVEGIVIGGIFGSADYTITGANTIEFVNVSTSLGPSQGGSGFPAQVTGLTVTPHAGSNTQLDLTWTTSGLSDFNFYNVYQGTVSGFIADSSSEIAQPVTNSYNNTGLDTGTTYYYRVSTTNDALLEGPVSSEVSGTTTAPADITPPPQTVGLATNVMSDTQINLTWTASAAGDLNHYDVHRSTTTGFTPNSGNRIFQPTSNSYNNTGLVASTIYYYKVAAVDNSGNIGTYSTQVSGTTAGDTTPPAQVTGLTATVISDTQINLSWTASAAGDLNHYDVHRSTSTGFTPSSANRISQPTTNSYNNTGLTASTLYYYKVGAVDNSGNIGTYSTQASGTTQAAPPPSTANLWLKFDGNYTDSSTFANTVNPSNTSGFAGSGVFGTNSVVLNTGAGIDYVAVPNNTNTALDLVNGFSYSLWIYITTVDASQYILSKRIDSNNLIGLYYSGSATMIGVDIIKAGTATYIKTPVGPTLNTWHHIVLTYDGTNPKIYLNKTLYTTTSAANFAPTVTTDLIVGNLAGSTSGNQRFHGRVDEVQYFKGVVLSQTQVDNLFATNDIAGTPDTTPPGQVTGLATNVISDTQINLSWTASAAGDLDHYDVHRSTTSGFTPAVGNRISQPTTNSYNNTGLTASTTYYYKVAAVDNASNIGTYSTQVTGTTTAGAGLTPTLLLHLDNDFTDSSGNGLSAALSPGFTNNNNGFVSPGKWGSHGLRLNYPTDNTATNEIDFINVTDNPLIQMNTSVGFSVSFWIYPVDLTAAGPAKRMLIWKQDNGTNRWSITVDTAGVVYFCVQKAGVDYKRQISGFITNAWQHVCAVFNGATNTVALYKDGVAGVSSTTTPQYTSFGSGSSHMIAGFQSGSIQKHSL